MFSLSPCLRVNIDLCVSVLIRRHNFFVAKCSLFMLRLKATKTEVLGTHAKAVHRGMDPVVSVSLLTGSFDSQFDLCALFNCDCCLFDQVHGSTFSQHSLTTTNNTLFG